MTYKACTALRDVLFLAAFFSFLVIRSMHETYVIGGISGNNWEREEIKVTKAGANWTVDEIVGEATGRGKSLPRVT